MNRLITPSDFLMEYQITLERVNALHVGPLSHLTTGRLEIMKYLLMALLVVWFGTFLTVFYLLKAGQRSKNPFFKSQ